MSEGDLVTMQYPPVLQQNMVASAPKAPEYEQDDDKKKYYKDLSRSYKEDNHDLLSSNVDLLKKNKKLIKENEKLKEENEKFKKEGKKINLELLQEMENNAVLESKALLYYKKYEHVRKLVKKQNKEHLKYCYIPKIFPRKKEYQERCQRKYM
jgi:hypothetical protein